MGKRTQKHWAGVDWGNSEHAMCVVSQSGERVARVCVPHTPAGLAQLVKDLEQVPGLGGVAVETNRGLVIQALMDAGLTVYAINPKVSANWRKTFAVCDPKNDARDALSLAHLLRERRQQFEPLMPEPPADRGLRLLCETEQRLIGQRTALVQKLQARLKSYYPAALAFIEDWTTQTAWDFVLQFPTPHKLARTRTATLVGFLKTHRIGLSPKWRARVEASKDATQWPCDETTADLESLEAIALAKLLRALEPSLSHVRKRIEAHFKTVDDHEVFQSLPGAGPKLAPRLKAELGSVFERYPSVESLERLSGVVPVTWQSGGSRRARMRRGCRRRFRNTLHHFAHQSTLCCAWAKAFHDMAKRKGQSEALALRNLARKWLKILYHMWREGRQYDDARFVAQLVKKRSPIAYEMGLLKTG